MAIIDGHQVTPSIGSVTDVQIITNVFGEDSHVSYMQGVADGIASVPDEPDFTAPTIATVSTFIADFRVDRLTPWEARLQEWPAGAEAIVLVRIAERNEVIVARDAEGTWCWPFDLAEDNWLDLESDPSLHLLPRGGWPPSEIEIQVAAALMAVPE